MVIPAQMGVLLARGRAVLLARHETMPRADRPIGTSMDIVLNDDFCAHAELCFAHVETTGRVLHVICGSMLLCVRVSRIAEWTEWRKP